MRCTCTESQNILLHSSSRIQNNHRQQFERIWGNQRLTEIFTRSQLDIIQGDGTPLSRGSSGRKTDLEGRYHSSSHYNDVIISAMASQITSLTIVYSTVYSGVDQGKHQSSASLAFVWGIHRWPVNSRHKGSVTRKMFPFEIMGSWCWSTLVQKMAVQGHYLTQCWIHFNNKETIARKSHLIFKSFN